MALLERKTKKNIRSGRSDKYKETELKDMQEIRKKQISRCNQTNTFMVHFVMILYEHINDEDTLMFFLSWLKHMLDNHSRKELPKHQYEFKKIFIRLMKAENEKQKEEHTRQLDIADQKIVKCSFVWSIVSAK